MNTFTLDTSGTVPLPDDVYDYARRARFGSSLTWEWPDLDAFTQGYIEALFASAWQPLQDQGPLWLRGPVRWRHAGFSDFAGETVAAILKDCAEAQRILGLGAVSNGGAGEKYRGMTGKRFWQHRQDRTWDRFPPLTAYLGDDGKVYLRGA